ncbi:hypothetical protein SAMN05444336_1191 [Albimonas donghaensis]|uniref:Uncharacterized protein n=1 Tax=Albimonas donghaensis TaxID=356660 RepID=A0A1H3G8V5_9RHOB|nr:hypothetical protein [Albimonas donghaensis]SDX98789.1 hypothetical protein SAMN05444336_1191 [Albimonas donghaensis]
MTDWDWLRARKRMFEDEVAELEATLEDDPDNPHRDLIEADIAHDKRLLKRLKIVLPD